MRYFWIKYLERTWMFSRFLNGYFLQLGVQSLNFELISFSKVNPFLRLTLLKVVVDRLLIIFFTSHFSLHCHSSINQRPVKTYPAPAFSFQSYKRYFCSKLRFNIELIQGIDDLKVCYKLKGEGEEIHNSTVVGVPATNFQVFLFLERLTHFHLLLFFRMVEIQ